MSIATVTSKGQITIPRDIRGKLNLHPGDKISFITDDKGKVYFLPTTRSITTLKGIVPKPDKPVTVEEMKATVKTKGGAFERNRH
jgi:antitoxin PrlF